MQMQQPHVPRIHILDLVGTSGMGPRGDCYIEADWDRRGVIKQHLESLVFGKYVDHHFKYKWACAQ